MKKWELNQTLHRLYINVNCNVSLLTPFKDVDEHITAQVLISETVISGDIPDAYYDLEGVSAEDTMNMTAIKIFSWGPSPTEK